MAKNITLAEAWVASIQPILESGQTLSISKCRFYLRKIEGAEIFLPNEYNFFRRSAHALAPLTSTPPPLVAESRVIKKPRPKKPKQEPLVPSQDSNSIKPFVMRQPYQPHPAEQRILPSQRFDHPQPYPYYSPNPVPSDTNTSASRSIPTSADSCSIQFRGTSCACRADAPNL